MPTLVVPEEYKSGLTKLLNLPDEAASELLAAIQRAPLRLYQTDLIVSLKEAVRSISAEDVAEIIEAIWSLEFVRAAAEVDVEQFLNDLEDAVKRAKLPVADVSRIRPRVGTLLTFQSLYLPSKARSLLREGNTYCTARILTDIRPIFGGEDVKSGPEAAVIVHNLRISYHQGTDLKSLVITLDSDDLAQLADILERAKMKKDKLEALLAAAKIPYLSVDES